MSKSRIIAITLLIAISGWAFAILNQAQATTNQVVFDHSNCQYPTRLTNPPEGCDNSDPACPIQKDGTERCEIIEQPAVVSEEPTKEASAACSN